MLVLMALFVSARPGEGTVVTRTDKRSGIPLYGLHGPHLVGKRNLVTNDKAPLEIKM